MFDLHCHLLPAIDDGAQSEAEAIALARAAVANGITHAVCTPHFHPGRFDSQVADTHDATPCSGAGHGVQRSPHDATSVFETHVPPHSW